MDVITKKSFDLALNWINVILFLFACEKISLTNISRCEIVIKFLW